MISYYRRANKKNYIEPLGVPQGLSISNILANIYLKEVDEKLHNTGLKYIRFVDDILIFLHKDDLLDIHEKVSTVLSDYHLSMNENKTDCQLSDCQFDYLGYKVSASQISIKDQNVNKFINSIAAKFASYTHNSENRLKKHAWLSKDIQKTTFVEDLNEKITGAISENKRYGWLFYFIEITDITLLHKLDSIIRGFFNRLIDFEYSPPHGLKKLATAYYKIKHSPSSGYIHNYDIYNSFTTKFAYLSNRGYINPEKNYRKEDIEIIFNRVRQKRLSDLELDVGLIS